MISNDDLKNKFKMVLIVEIIIALIIVYTIIFHRPNYYKGFKYDFLSLSQNTCTSNTTRINGANFKETAVAISQINYPATFYNNRPNGVILVNGDKKEEAILASRLMHDPINAPILYIDKDGIPKSTLDEIKRLNPKGIMIDKNNKVIVIGKINDKIKNQLNKINMKFRNIDAENIFELGKNIDDYCAALMGNHKDTVMIVPVDMVNDALSQVAWSAYSGDPIFFIEKNKVPKEVEQSLSLRHGGCYIYMVGDDKLIENKTKNNLLKYGHLQHASVGNDVYAQSVSFAILRDIGKDSAWWVNNKPKYFGWGIAESGHNFIFVNPSEWQSVVSASGLSYKAKYGPMLLVQKDKISENIVRYLKLVEPMKVHPQGQMYNHGWIIGNYESIDKNIQGKLDSLLDCEVQTYDK